jgi:hypothetical protein
MKVSVDFENVGFSSDEKFSIAAKLSFIEEEEFHPCALSFDFLTKLGNIQIPPRSGKFFFLNEAKPGDVRSDAVRLYHYLDCDQDYDAPLDFNDEDDMMFVNSDVENELIQSGIFEAARKYMIQQFENSTK